jgi:hypothetical protein
VRIVRCGCARIKGNRTILSAMLDNESSVAPAEGKNGRSRSMRAPTAGVRAMSRRAAPVESARALLPLPLLLPPARARILYPPLPSPNRPRTSPGPGTQLSGLASRARSRRGLPISISRGLHYTVGPARWLPMTRRVLNGGIHPTHGPESVTVTVTVPSRPAHSGGSCRSLAATAAGASRHGAAPALRFPARARGSFPPPAAELLSAAGRVGVCPSRPADSAASGLGAWAPPLATWLPAAVAPPPANIGYGF